jgi:gamma-glutamyltranspeptidase/glutathione hydrolase
MDAKGNVVSSTQTINGYFGSALVAEGTGIVLNNEMNDFTTKPGEQNIYGAVGGEKNIVEPRKRPLSSMSPTIVTNEQGPVLSLGSPSGTRILTCVALTIMNYLEHGLSLEESVTAVRYHQQWYPDLLIVEERGLPDSTMKRLKQIGHEIMLRDYGCRIQAVSKEGDNLIGVSDPRGAGMALGK